MPESPAYAHREALLSTISLHHHWAQLEHSACGAGRGGTTGTVSGAVSGAVNGVVSGAVSGAVGGAVSGAVGGAVRIVYISFNALTPCPEIAATWPGDSGCGTSGTSV